jgi:hypothetical protein
MNAVRHEDAPPEAPRNRVRFDPTINLGHVLTALAGSDTFVAYVDVDWFEPSSF